jgi:DNA-binding CsgD family transcriptional regulator
LLVRANDLAAGIPLLERALALAGTYDDPVEAAAVCADLAQSYVWTAQFERSQAVSRQRAELAQRSQQTHHLAYAYTWQAFLEAARGRWPAAEDFLNQARSLAERITSADPLAFWRQVRGYLAYQRGDYALAEQESTAAVAAFRAHDPGELILCLGLLGLASLALGNRAGFQACTVEQEALLRTLTTGSLSTLSAQGCLALAAVTVGDAEGIRRHYEELLAGQGQHHWFLVDRILGQAALLLGNCDAAGGHLATAEAIARREDLRPELSRILEAQADLALTLGGAGSAQRARDLLGQALGVWRELGVTAKVRRLRQLLHDLPRQPGERPAAPLPAGLTRREAEVLRLVAAGLSNRDVAARLALSESTVARHLSSIFAKTATDNRVEAAGFAHRHGLA